MSFDTNYLIRATTAASVHPFSEEDTNKCIATYIAAFIQETLGNYVQARCDKKLFDRCVKALAETGYDSKIEASFASNIKNINGTGDAAFRLKNVSFR